MTIDTPIASTRSDEAVTSPAIALLTTKLHHAYVAGSLVEGNAVPDLVVAACFPEVFRFTSSITGDAADRTLDVRILAYLRAVRGGVRLLTIAERLDRTEEDIDKRIGPMIDAEAVRWVSGLYYIDFAWRHILPEIITINTADASDPESLTEDDWRGTVTRAIHNRIFAHRTFVALPDRLAQSVKADPIFRESAVGLLSLPEAPLPQNPEDLQVTPLVNSVKLLPTDWLHYYSVALPLAYRFDGK